MTRTGKSCTYGITLIKNCANAEGAKLFLAYLLDVNGGLKVLEEMGQPPFKPARVPTDTVKTALPDDLVNLVEVKQ